MKSFKKVLALFLALVMSMALLAGCGGGNDNTNNTPNDSQNNTQNSTPSNSSNDSNASGGESGGRTIPDKQYVIGIAEAQANDEVTTRRAYLENYIAPNYNVKFIFSETLADDAATKTFVENCIDAGVDAVIDFKTSGAMAKLCMDNDIGYSINGAYTQHPELLTEDFTTFVGCVGANNAQVGGLFKDWLTENASADGSEGFLVSTSLASSGNPQHIEITRAILEGLQEKYGLTYTKSIEELYQSTETTNAENDKGILITLYPGSPNKETWLPGISALIQSGDYGIFASSGQTYNQSATVVNEVEAATGMDIKVASVGALGTTLTTAFNTSDPQGNPSIDLATVKSCSALTACIFAITYNQITGYGDQMRKDDGTPEYFTFNFIGVTSPEQLGTMEGWDDRDAQYWITTTDQIDQMLGVYNPDVTPQVLLDIMDGMTYDNIKTWMQ